MRPQSSMLAKMIDNKGLMYFGGPGGSKPLDLDSIEADIEAALMRFAANNEVAVLVLRVEYGAISHHRLRGLTKQREKALALGMSLRTYQTKLSQVKAFLRSELGE